MYKFNYETKNNRFIDKYGVFLVGLLYIAMVYFSITSIAYIFNAPVINISNATGKCFSISVGGEIKKCSDYTKEEKKKIRKRYVR